MDEAHRRQDRRVRGGAGLARYDAPEHDRGVQCLEFDYARLVLRDG